MSTLFDLTEEPEMKTTALVPWFGSNRMLGHTVGEELRGCKWIGIPFAGGMCELAHVKAPTIVVNDLHRHVMNLASVIACERGADVLAKHLASLSFHPDTLEFAQRKCEEMERGGWDFGMLGTEASTSWAVNYFVSQWMGRSGIAGTDREFAGKLPIRWNASGGDSNTRYRSAIESIHAWSAIMRGCNFSTLDAFEFLDTVKDEPRHAIYCDPPFPDAGDDYKHKFTPAQHKQLALCLFQFKQARVVSRFYDHPLIRELYPEPHWTWRMLRGRDQANQSKPEVLLINGLSLEVK